MEENVQRRDWSVQIQWHVHSDGKKKLYISTRQHSTDWNVEMLGEKESRPKYVSYFISIFKQKQHWWSKGFQSLWSCFYWAFFFCLVFFKALINHTSEWLFICVLNGFKPIVDANMRLLTQWEKKVCGTLQSCSFMAALEPGLTNMDAALNIHMQLQIGNRLPLGKSGIFVVFCYYLNTQNALLMLPDFMWAFV